MSNAFNDLPEEVLQNIFTCLGDSLGWEHALICHRIHPIVQNVLYKHLRLTSRSLAKLDKCLAGKSSAERRSFLRNIDSLFFRSKDELQSDERAIERLCSILSDMSLASLCLEVEIYSDEAACVARAISTGRLRSIEISRSIEGDNVEAYMHDWWSLLERAAPRLEKLHLKFVRPPADSAELSLPDMPYLRDLRLQTRQTKYPILRLPEVIVRAANIQTLHLLGFDKRVVALGVEHCGRTLLQLDMDHPLSILSNTLLAYCPKLRVLRSQPGLMLEFRDKPNSSWESLPLSLENVYMGHADDVMLEELETCLSDAAWLPMLKVLRIGRSRYQRSKKQASWEDLKETCQQRQLELCMVSDARQ